MSNSHSKRRSMSHLPSPVRGRDGFSLVEVMVVAGIMGVLVLGITTVMVRSQRQAQSVSAKSDFNSLVNTLQGIFNNTSSCLQAFGGPDAPVLDAFPKTVSVTIGGSPITVGQHGNSLKITKFELTGKTAAGPTNQWVVPLSMVVDRSTANENAVGGNNIAHTFNLIVTLDNNNKMVGCSGQFTNFWVSTSNPSNIAYIGGNVGLATDNPSSLLDVNGTAQATAFMYKSDRRYKENVREIPSALERVAKLHGVLVDWKDKRNLSKSTDQLGLIAQEVEEVFPEAVITDPETGMKSVAYGNLIAPLIEAIKAQQEVITKQQQEIAEIKKSISF